MDNPYEARVSEQHFLNLPGFHAGAFVRAYVEDTSGRELPVGSYGSEEGLPRNFEPRIVLQIADCSNQIYLEFEIDSPHQRMNSFHKIDTLIGALTKFRDGLAAESAEYKRRQKIVDAAKADKETERTADRRLSARLRGVA